MALILAAVLLATADPDPDAITGASMPPASERLSPPVPVGPATIAMPEGAMPEEPLTVRVLIRVDEAGQVDRVQLIDGAGEPYDSAVLLGATAFSFDPARLRGERVAVEISFEQVFVPAEPTVDPGPPLVAELRGVLVERGTRRKLEYVPIAVQSTAGEYFTQSKAGGIFSLRLPAGEAAVEISSVQHRRFVVGETLAEGESLEVRYLLERRSYDPYETIVVGRRERDVVSRTTLRDRELRRVPGTFGDPFRVIATMPGVSQVFSLLNYPIVRGTSPGNTGFLFDGVRVPQLFHLLAGPAVLHPELIERVDFYPGNFPVQYGGYTGGIVDGVSRQARRDEATIEADLDLTKTGLFLRGPIEALGVSGTLAGRYGYPSLVTMALNVPIRLQYWDYQVRLDGLAPQSPWKVFAFGAFDELEQVEDDGDVNTTARTMFHRIDLAYQSRGTVEQLYEVVLGYDDSFGQDDIGTLRSFSVEPRARWGGQIAEPVRVFGGIEGAFRNFSGVSQVGEADIDVQSQQVNAGAFVEAQFELPTETSITPGVRTDVYHNSEATQASVDPRVAIRQKMGDFNDGEMWLKAAVGLFHQPPRFLVPIPGLEEVALEEGLIESIQTSFGVEVPVYDNLTLDATLYYQHMDPLILDLAINDDPTAEPRPDDGFASELFAKRVGRSYGLELLIRKPAEGPVFGWLSYTLSWSERKHQGRWVPFDFDRRHVLQAVMGVALPRNWEVGARVLVQSGRAVSSTTGYNDERSAPFVRFDIRVDKRAVWNEWLFDFYVDIINVTLTPEPLGFEGDEGAGDATRYVLPTVGVRAVI